MLREEKDSTVSLLVVDIESKISLSKEIYKLYANATNTNLKNVMQLYITNCMSHERIT